MKTLPVILAVLVLLGAGCAGTDTRERTLPRPTAWPRTRVYDSVFTAVPSLPVSLEANAAATVMRKEGRNAAVDIAYPAYKATVYVTVIGSLTNPDSFLAVWNNRRERLNRNLGGTPYSAVSVPNAAGYQCALVRTNGASQTPVQLLAGNIENGTVVTATAFLHNTITAAVYDSVAPTIRALESDLTRMAQTLGTPAAHK